MTLKRSLAIARDAGAAAPDAPKIFPKNDIMNTVACFSDMNGESTTLFQDNKRERSKNMVLPMLTYGVTHKSMFDGTSKDRTIHHFQAQFELQQRFYVVST
jgi:hypothetical protein